MHASLTPVIPLFYSAAKSIKNKAYLWWFLLSGLVFALVMRLLALLPPFLFIVMQVSEQQGLYVALIGLTVLLTIYASVFFFALFLLVSVRITKGERIVLSDSMREAHRSVFRTTGTIIAFGFLVLVSLILLIIPGIIVGIWFFFAPTIAVLGTTKRHLFKQSRALVKGRFFAVFWRVLLISLCSSGLSYLLSFVHPILTQVWVITTPFFSLLYTVVYLDLLPKTAKK